ncbi:MAG TPA: cytochrome c [Vicinamibacteria bacterium]|nr:cytochrome c [Vicinamibacteria bacterium]
MNLRRSFATPSLALALLLPVAAAAQEKPTEATLELYKTKCLACHLADGNSPIPEMNFANGAWKHGTRVADLVKAISEGVPGTAMLAFKDQLSAAEIEALARYVRSFDKKLKPEKAVKGAK